MQRLSENTLAQLPAAIARPAYERKRIGTGIVHLGIGAFHRAHQAVYTDDVLARDGGDWGICGVSLRQPEMHDRLAPQDGLYTVVERDGAGERLRIIGAVRECLFAPQNPAGLLSRLADPATRIVSLTVTEKGYCHDPASGRLQENHPDIEHDLRQPEAPRSAIAYLARALDRRRQENIAPFTVLSCDNLPQNGKTVRGIVLAFAELIDPALARWIEETVLFPCTMVDRIVPATTEADRAGAAEKLQLRDEAAVVCEPFRQWVIEDAFNCGRPAWEHAGAEMVDDVIPFEEMKLRLLNGSHSTLAYLGYLAGCETIADTMRDPAFVQLVRGLMDEEVTPTLALPPGADLPAYKNALIERFSNPALHHRTWQIAMDGSQKLPQRLLDTARDRLAAGASVRRIALAVAGWMVYVGGVDENQQPIDVRDPLAAELRQRAQSVGREPEARATALLAMEGIFGADLPRVEPFRRNIVAALASLFDKGAQRTVAEWTCFL